MSSVDTQAEENASLREKVQKYEHSMEKLQRETEEMTRKHEQLDALLQEGKERQD